MFWSSCNRCEEYKNETTLQDTFNLDSMINAIYAKTFRDVNEPMLGELNHEAYRLIFWGSFYDEALIIRISALDDVKEMTVKVYKRVGPYENRRDSIVEAHKISLSMEEWVEFSELIDSTQYWSMPVFIGDGRLLLDGDTRNLQGRRPQAAICERRTNYTVRRKSPDEGGFRTLCEKMMDMAEEHRVDLSLFRRGYHLPEE